MASWCQYIQQALHRTAGSAFSLLRTWGEAEQQSALAGFRGEAPGKISVILKRFKVQNTIEKRKLRWNSRKKSAMLPSIALNPLWIQRCCLRLPSDCPSIALNPLWIQRCCPRLPSDCLFSQIDEISNVTIFNRMLNISTRCHPCCVDFQKLCANSISFYMILSLATCKKTTNYNWNLNSPKWCCI